MNRKKIMDIIGILGEILISILIYVGITSVILYFRIKSTDISLKKDETISIAIAMFIAYIFVINFIFLFFTIRNKKM